MDEKLYSCADATRLAVAISAWRCCRCPQLSSATGFFLRLLFSAAADHEADTLRSSHESPARGGVILASCHLHSDPIAAVVIVVVFVATHVRGGSYSLRAAPVLICC